MIWKGGKKRLCREKGRRERGGKKEEKSTARKRAIVISFKSFWMIEVIT